MMQKSVLFLCIMFAWQGYAGTTALKTLQRLEQRLRIKDPDAVVSAYFVRKDGRKVLALHPDSMVKLASVTKLFTAVTALEHLGAGHRFITRVFFQKKNRKLYIQGGWDPLLNARDMQELAECVRKKVGKGPARVFVVQKPRKKLPYCGPKDKNDHVYAAGPAELMVNLSAVKVTVGPVRNKQMSVTIQPDAGDFFDIDSHVRVVRRGRRPRVAVKSQRGKGQTIIRIRGRFPMRAKAASVLKRVFHPLMFAAWVFQRSLNIVGVKTLQKPTITSYARGGLICTHKSDPISRLLIPILQKSLNPGAQAIADAIFPGNQVRSLQIIENTLKKAGIPQNKARISNGSGLGCGGISTTRSIVKLLMWTLGRPWSRSFWHALPRPGKGTLKHRFLGGPANLSAKTGTLDDCTALAGAFDNPEGKRIFFAIVVNARGMNRPSVVHRINKIIESFGKQAATRCPVSGAGILPARACPAGWKPALQGGRGRGASASQ